MIPERVWEYTQFNLITVTMAPHETREFPAFNAMPCLGSMYVYGYITPIGGTSWKPIVPHRDWRDRSVWGGWDRPDATEGSASFKAGPNGAKWLCLTRNRRTPENLTITKQIVDGSYTVEAGRGVLVGWVEPIAIAGAEGDEAIEYKPGKILVDRVQQAVTENFIAKRAKNYEITGTADLLLVR